MDERTKALASAIAIIAVEVCALFGQTIDADAALHVAMAVMSVAATIYGIWKNHNFTPEAQRAQELLDELKGARNE